MPGIVGLITKLPRQQAEAQLARMLKTMQHEPSYATGTYIDEASGVYAGWTTRKGSFSDAMPLRDASSNLVLLFGGEEFPAPDTLARFAQSNGNSAGPSYLVHMAAQDPSFPVGLNGRFQGLLIDAAKKRATLFNDRFGMHRIYYHEAKDAFYFSAEAKAILAVCPELKSVDPRGLGEFVSCGCVLQNRTLFKDIFVLPPASAWVFQDGGLKDKKPYFDPKEWENQERLESEAYYQELRSVFSRNLPRYFTGSEKVGISLTGGLDTRMIMAWKKPSPGSLPCYSFGGPFRDSEDVLLARKIASACNQPFEVIEVANDFLSKFPRYAERAIYMTDGCASVRASSDLYCNERAAKIGPVRMTGNYGGEVLRRLRAFKYVQPAPGLFQQEFLTQVAAAKETYAEISKVHPLSFSVFRQAPWHHFGLLALEQTQVAIRSPYLDNDLVRTVYRAPDANQVKSDIFEDKDDYRVRLIYDGDAALGRIRTDRGLAGASGAVSTALTRGWLEGTFKAEYAYDYGMPQWMSKIDHSLSFLHLERLFLGRHKFNHFRVWYRDALSNYVREMLLDPRTLNRPYLNRERVETVVKGHLDDGLNFTTEIHSMLNLELIHRTLIDAN